MTHVVCFCLFSATLASENERKQKQSGVSFKCFYREIMDMQVKSFKLINGSSNNPLTRPQRSLRARD